MNFRIDHTRVDGVEYITMQDEISKTSVQLLPEVGALLHAFTIVMNETFFNCIDNYTHSEQLHEQLDKSYKGAKLSPFVCRIKNGRYNFKGKNYEFSQKFFDGSAIHGLLYNKPFEVISESCDDDQAMVTLFHHYHGREDAGYPFEFDCMINYILHRESALTLATTVTNLSNHPIPCADGWHPYFQLGGKIDDYELRLASDTMVEFENLIPTGRLIKNSTFLHGRKIADQEIDHCFLQHTYDGNPSFILHNPANRLTIENHAPFYPYIQIYTPPGRTSIAIENLTGAPDCFNNGMGLIELAPGESAFFTALYRLSIDK